jgi:hypothetical protein
VKALKSSVDSRSDEFRANPSAMRGLVNELRERFAIVSDGAYQRNERLLAGLAKDKRKMLLDLYM